MYIGETDLAAELVILALTRRRRLKPSRTVVVFTSSAAGINPLVGPVDTTFREQLPSIHVDCWAAPTG